MNSNKTFTMLKPDSIEQGYMLPILNTISDAGFKIIALKYKKMSRTEAESFTQFIQISLSLTTL